MQHVRQQMPILFTKISVSILVISLPVLYVSFLHIPPSNLLKDTTFWFLMSNSIIVIIAADSGMLSSKSTAASPAVTDGGATDSPDVCMGRSLVVREEKARVVIKKSETPRLVPSSNSPDASSAVADGGATDATDVCMDKSLVVREDKSHALTKKCEAPRLVGCRRTELSSSSPAASSAVAICADDEATATDAADVCVDKSVVVREDDVAMRTDKAYAVFKRSETTPRPPRQRAVDKSIVVSDGEKAALRRSATEGRKGPSPAPAQESEYYASLSDQELNRRVEEFIKKFNREIRLQIEKERV